MSKYLPLYALQQRRQPASEAGRSDAFPFPVKRGTAPAPERESGDSFEQTYPKHAFSELVRLGVALAGRIGAWRRRAPARPEKRQCDR